MLAYVRSSDKPGGFIPGMNVFLLVRTRTPKILNPKPWQNPKPQIHSPWFRLLQYFSQKERESLDCKYSQTAGMTQRLSSP